MLRTGGLALWRQIVQALEGEINDGSRPPGAQLPTEAQLAARFGVNRHTVRRALEELSHNGLVRVGAGGVAASWPRMCWTTPSRPGRGFPETIRRHNREPSGRVLDLREIAADTRVAAGLGMRAGARVVRLERLGMADGRPVALGAHHFPAARLPGLLEALRRLPTISEALAAVGVRDYRRQTTRISARLPQPHEAALLSTPRNRPLLVSENINVDQDGTIIEFGIGLHPTPRVQIVSNRRTSMTSIRITGGRVLLDGALEDTDIALDGGRIGALGGGGGREFDATGLLVLPGIVDIHGDAFERQIQPRPGVGFPMGFALEETERQLLACGVTTAFHGVTLSWEPGLRSLETWSALLDGLAARGWACDMRVHLRWEAFNLAALDTALADIAAGRVHLLAFNDHTPAILRRLADPAKATKYSERAGMGLAEFRAIADSVAAREAEVLPALERLAAAARAAGLPMASHDDDTVATRDAFRARGAGICEFPMEEAVGRAARDAGDAVVMGSPNVVRGGSHLGWASAARLAEADICTVLSSDYYYPCLMRAAFILAGRGVLDLPSAWALVSTNPAAAAGLADRGRIAPGLRADLVLVDPVAMRAVATITAGAISHLGADAWIRIGAVAS